MTKAEELNSLRYKELRDLVCRYCNDNASNEVCDYKYNHTESECSVFQQFPEEVLSIVEKFNVDR